MTDQNPTQPYAPQPNEPQPSATPVPDAAPTVPVDLPAAPPSASSAPPAPPPAPSVPPPPVWASPSAAAMSAPPAQSPAPAGTPPGGVEVPAAPIGGGPRPRRGGPLRWIVALLVVALVVAGGIGATLLLTSSTAASSPVLAYAPSDAILYAEARLDLPGNQRAELAKTLSAFPGFADQAALNTKLGELYDRLIKAASGGKHDYQTEIAPWFAGQLAVAEGPQAVSSLAGLAGASPVPAPTSAAVAALPACTGGPAATSSPAASSGSSSGTGAVVGGIAQSVRMVLLAGVTDTAKASAWVGSVLSGMGSTTSTTDITCDGVTVHLVSSSGAPGLPQAGWAILGGRVLAAGDLDSIRLAIATKGTSGLGADATFQKAVAALPGDHLGFLYENLKATLASQLDTIKALDTDGTATAAIGVLQGLVPEWMAANLTAGDGNFVVQTAQPSTDAQPSTNRASDLAGLAPAKTIALVDWHDVGKSLTALHDKFAADPKLKAYVDQLDTALGLVGGLGATLGWIGDAGIAFTRDGSNVSGGVIIRPDDGAAATRLFTQLRSLVELGGAGSGLAINDEQYKGATITSVDLSALAPLLQQSLGSSGATMTVPKDLKFVYTATDKVVVLTVDPGFAKAVIDASQGGDALAKDARFSALLAKAGTKGTGLVWVDVSAVRELAEGMLPADSRAKYEADIRPYLLPIDALVSVGVADTGLSRGTMILSIKH